MHKDNRDDNFSFDNLNYDILKMITFTSKTIEPNYINKNQFKNIKKRYWYLNWF